MLVFLLGVYATSQLLSCGIIIMAQRMLGMGLTSESYWPTAQGETARRWKGLDPARAKSSLHHADT